MKYDAFISYRHTPLDMEIAKKLHRGLETFSIPAAVQKKTGKKKIRRVFRDQEELPIGSNLTEEINAALENTEYLIVVCSPDTPESEWVQKEIDTFIELHGHSNILAILIDGEPEDSFPPAILKDENGNPVEPLAADIRGANRTERNHKFKTELLRLAAPVIGCSFDDLRQRHRERQVRKAIAYVTTVALVTGGAGAAFGLYNASVAKQMETLAQEKGSLASNNAQLGLEISQEFRDKQINQSRFYATESLSLLSEGSRKQAALVACMGLPSEKLNRPYVAEAEYALSKALHAYDDGTMRDYYYSLEHELPVSKVLANETGTRLITMDSGNNVHVWDSTTWEELVCISPEIMEDNYLNLVINASADEHQIYILTKKRLLVYDYSGQLKYQIDKPDIHDYASGTFVVDENKAFLTNGYVLQIVQLSDGLIMSQYDNPDPGLYNNQQKFDTNTGLFINGHNNAEESKAMLTILHSREDVCFETELSFGHAVSFGITKNGNIVALSCADDAFKAIGPSQITMELFSPDGEKLWSRDFTPYISNYFEYSKHLKSYINPTDSGDRCTIVFCIEDEMYCFDEQDGSEILHLALQDNVTAILPPSYGTNGYIAYKSGDIQLTNFEDGRVYDDPSNRHIQNLIDMISINNAFVTRTAYDKNINVIAYQKAPDCENLPVIGTNMYVINTSPNGDYYILQKSADDNIYDFYDPDGNQIYETTINNSYVLGSTFCGNVYVTADRNGIHFLDPITKTTQNYDYAQLGIDSSSIGRVRFSQNGNYGTVWNGNQLYILDLNMNTCIAQTQTDNEIGAAIITENGASVFISETYKNLYVLDIASGNITTFEDNRLQQISNQYSLNYLAVSPNGRYAAMSCSDQKVWILDTQNGNITGGLPMQLADRSYLNFSNDSQYLFLQGNDYVFRIWNVVKEEYINSISTNSSIKYTVYDTEDKKLALITGYSLYYLNLDDYRQCAYVPDCIAYIKDTNSFIQYYRGNVFRCQYKNYQSLIEETRRQFPGAELTNIEMVEYNIN